MKKRILFLTLSAMILNAQEPATEDSMPTVDSLLVEQDYSEDSAISEGIDSNLTDTSEEQSDEQELTGYSTFRFTLGGSLYDLSDLNSAMALYGYPTVDRGVVQFGFGQTSQKTKIVKDFGLTVHSWRNAINRTRKTDLTGVDLALTYGFDIVKVPSVSLFPYVGADVGILLLKMSYQGIAFDAIGSGIAPEDQILHRITSNLHAGVGFDLRKKRDGFAPSIGFRAGYRFDLTNPSNWKRDWSGVDFAPEVSTSSFYAKLVFGIALPR